MPQAAADVNTNADFLVGADLKNNPFMGKNYIKLKAPGVSFFGFSMLNFSAKAELADGLFGAATVAPSTKFALKDLGGVDVEVTKLELKKKALAFESKITAPSLDKAFEATLNLSAKENFVTNFSEASFSYAHELAHVNLKVENAETGNDFKLGLGFAAAPEVDMGLILNGSDNGGPTTLNGAAQYQTAPMFFGFGFSGLDLAAPALPAMSLSAMYNEVADLQVGVTCKFVDSAVVEPLVGLEYTGLPDIKVNAMVNVNEPNTPNVSAKYSKGKSSLGVTASVDGDGAPTFVFGVEIA